MFGKLGSIVTVNPKPVGIFTSSEGFENITVYVNNQNNTAVKYSIGVTTDGVTTNYLNRYNVIAPRAVVEEDKIYIDFDETLVVQSSEAGVSFAAISVGGGTTAGYGVTDTLVVTDANKGTILELSNPSDNVKFTLGINNLSYETSKVWVGIADSITGTIDDGWIIHGQQVVPSGNFIIRDLVVGADQKIFVKSTVKDVTFTNLGVPATAGGGGGGGGDINVTLGLGNTTDLGMSVGLSTFNQVVTIGGATTALYVDGDARITGVMTVGNDSITLAGHGDIHGVGILTANEFRGDLVGAVSGDINATGVSTFVDIVATNIDSITNINATGVVTAGSIACTGDAEFQNITVAGTVTYDDVTNVDSLGIITSREGIHVSGIVTARPGFAITYYGNGETLTGVTTGVTVQLDSYGGVSPFVKTGTKNITVTIGSTSNAYGVKYVSSASTPGNNSVGNDGDIWYFTG